METIFLFNFSPIQERNSSKKQDCRASPLSVSSQQGVLSRLPPPPPTPPPRCPTSKILLHKDDHRFIFFLRRNLLRFPQFEASLSFLPSLADSSVGLVFFGAGPQRFLERPSPLYGLVGEQVVEIRPSPLRLSQTPSLAGALSHISGLILSLKFLTGGKFGRPL